MFCVNIQHSNILALNLKLDKFQTIVLQVIAEKKILEIPRMHFFTMQCRLLKLLAIKPFAWTLF